MLSTFHAIPILQARFVRRLATIVTDVNLHSVEVSQLDGRRRRSGEN